MWYRRLLSGPCAPHFVRLLLLPRARFHYLNNTTTTRRPQQHLHYLSTPIFHLRLHFFSHATTQHCLALSIHNHSLGYTGPSSFLIRQFPASVTMGRRGVLDLPEELVSNIATKLCGDDKCALRLTCCALDEKSFHEFATEHFSEKCVHFTTDSLKALVGISHSRLAKYVKEISVVTALFSEQAFTCPGREAPHWRPTTRQSEAYRFYISDQASLRTTGHDKKMLTEAFKYLPNLKTVGFIDSDTALGPSVDYRGSRKVFRQTGKCISNILLIYSR